MSGDSYIGRGFIFRGPSPRPSPQGKGGIFGNVGCTPGRIGVSGMVAPKKLESPYVDSYMGRFFK
jgi:hypothetical protein